MQSKAPLKAKVTGAWRVYDAICNLGLSGCREEEQEEISTARKVAWERYNGLSKMLERKAKGERP